MVVDIIDGPLPFGDIFFSAVTIGLIVYTTKEIDVSKYESEELSINQKKLVLIRQRLHHPITIKRIKIVE